MRAIRGLLIVSVGLVIGSEANASGFYNMPTSLRQCLGVGFGPGYHAPLLLGPMMRGSVAAQPIQRLPQPLSPPGSCGFDEPSYYSAPVEAYGAHGMGIPMTHSAPLNTTGSYPMVHQPVIQHHAGPVFVAPSAAAADPYAKHEVVPAPEAKR